MSTTYTLRVPRRVIGFHQPGEDFEVVQPENQEDEHYEQMSHQLLLLQSRIEQLEKELQAAREDAYNLGFQDGMAAEQKRHQEELTEHASRINDLAENLEREFSQLLDKLEGPLLNMSFQIAERILTIPLPDDVRQDALVGTIRSFLGEVLHEGSVVIHVSSDNLALIQSKEASQELEQSFPGKIRFVANSNLGPGECMVETPEHIIDGRYKTQLAILESKTT